VRLTFIEPKLHWVTNTLVYWPKMSWLIPSIPYDLSNARKVSADRHGDYTVESLLAADDNKESTGGVEWHLVWLP
jgi:hypothetical protein